jgi:hypothetical protein
MASGFCSKTVHLTDPSLIRLVEAVAQVRKCSLEHVIAEAVAYRYGEQSPVVEDWEREVLFPDSVTLITEGDGDDD